MKRQNATSDVDALLAMTAAQLEDWAITVTGFGTAKEVGCDTANGKKLVAALRAVGATAKYIDDMGCVLVFDYTTPEQDAAEDYRESGKQARDAAFRKAGM